MKLFIATILVFLSLSVGLVGQGIVDHAVTKPRPGVEIDWGKSITRGRKAWWLFNQGAGSRLTDIAGENHGVLTDMNPSSAWVGSPRGGGLKFNGSNNYVRISESPSLDMTDAITITAWVNVRALVASARFLEKPHTSCAPPFVNYFLGLSHAAVGSDEFRLELNIDGTIRTVDGNTNVTLNRWTHVVGTYDGSNMRLYVDGLEDGVTVIAGSIGTNNMDVVLGLGVDGCTGSALDGMLDDVSIHNRALSAEEVRELFHSPYAGVLHIAERLTRWFVSLEEGNPSLINFPLVF